MQRKQTFFWLDFPPGVCVCASVCVLPGRCHLHVETGIKVECYTWSHSLSFHLPQLSLCVRTAGICCLLQSIRLGQFALGPVTGICRVFQVSQMHLQTSSQLLLSICFPFTPVQDKGLQVKQDTV